MIDSVLLAGGGTAGHVNPLLAVADELRRRNPATAIAVLGTSSGLEADLVPARGYELDVIGRVPFPRRPNSDWFAFPGRLRAAIRETGRVLDARGVQVVVGFGGYVSTPAYIAARRRGIPVIIHEQNARPGMANKLGARWAAAVAVTFPGTPLANARVTGMPLRSEIVDLVARRAAGPVSSREQGARALGLDPSRPVLLVTGGSLGALRINAAMVGAFDALAKTNVQVLHLTGRGKSDDLRAAVEHQGEDFARDYHVREYLDEMHEGLAVADLVLCRSGAGTVAELTALGIPAVYVPFPIGNGEQRLNAQPAIDAGGALVIEDGALSARWITQTLLPLLADPEELARMSQFAVQVGRVDAAEAVADLAEEYARKDRS